MQHPTLQQLGRQQLPLKKLFLQQLYLCLAATAALHENVQDSSRKKEEPVQELQPWPKEGDTTGSPVPYTKGLDLEISLDLVD
jgi:hypothetical protein